MRSRAFPLFAAAISACIMSAHCCAHRGATLYLSCKLIQDEVTTATRRSQSDGRPTPNVFASLKFETQSLYATYRITFRDLRGALLAAVVKDAKGGAVRGVICGRGALPCPLENEGLLRGMWSVPDDLVEDLLLGRLYMEFATTSNPLGEVRGQIL